MIISSQFFRGPTYYTRTKGIKMKKREEKKATNKDSGKTAELCLQQSVLNKRNNHAFVQEPMSRCLQLPY